MKHLIFKVAMISAVLISTSCKKDFLETKPNKALLVPEKLEDFQALLDNNQDMNQVGYLTVVSTDDLYSTDAGLNTMNVHIRNSYLWSSNIYEGLTVADWNIPFTQIFYSNIILDGLDKIKPTELTSSNANSIKGSALFFRALAYHNLSTQFCKSYDETTAESDLGLPIRTKSDVNIKVERSNLKDTYGQIVDDLISASHYLPITSSYKTRPTRAAAYALLARVYLLMGDYSSALKYSDECLKLNDKLIDYNTLTATASRPFPQALPNGNDEVLFYSQILNTTTLTTYTTTRIVPELYDIYDANDLRKVMFFNNRGNGVVTFKGNYSGSLILFGGIATDEVYLTRAECYARLDRTEMAIDDLNKLIKSRWSNKVTYPKITASNSDEALAKILLERRKELVYRNIRWFDLKRLNKELKYSKTLTRIVNGTTLTLPPNDKRYVFQIPNDEIQRSGIKQND